MPNDKSPRLDAEDERIANVASSAELLLQALEGADVPTTRMLHRFFRAFARASGVSPQALAAWAAAPSSDDLVVARELRRRVVVAKGSL